MWLLAVIALISAGLIALVLLTGRAHNPHLERADGGESAPPSRPSRWSRGTRVNAAKLVSTWVLGLAVVAVTLLVGALANVVGQI